MIKISSTAKPFSKNPGSDITGTLYYLHEIFQLRATFQRAVLSGRFFLKSLIHPRVILSSTAQVEEVIYA